MGVEEAAVNSIMSGIENTGTIKQHNHKKKLRQRFDIIKKLGQGTFGKVQLGINKETGQEVAIKTIKKSKIESDADLIRIRREIQIMSSVQHPNIIHIYEVFENREKMVLVMEYAAGGELYDYLSERKVLQEEEARRIFRQIATACYYCHKHKICHRDLKLENILLDENNNAKIADFGLSNVFDDQRLLNTFCGSPLYASPEIVKGTPYHGPEVDCWSLGVLLYTLVYGAMPFDGSNFKRLVKQISQGDYYEPSKPSPASPLIREMLTVNPKTRADIEKICNNWWVNETYDVSCFDISEELANQTPVRLDVLLSLAPPAPQLESDKLVVTGEEETTEAVPPTRSQSAGSLMELSTPERRIMDMINDEKFASKRKLESTVSTDRVNLDKRKDKIVKENTVADITVHGTTPLPLDKSSTQTISKEMDVESEGAACQEILEEAKQKKSKVKRTQSTLEGINEVPSQENLLDKENKEEVKEEKPVKKKIVKKKVLSDKNDNDKDKQVNGQDTAKPVERRKSRIFEAAEKFQSLISPTESKPAVVDKPKKISIPGVSVDGFKKEFERKSSLTSTAPIKPKLNAAPKKTLIDKQKSEEEEKNADAAKVVPDVPNQDIKTDDLRKEKVKNAVNIISNALDKEGTRKSKSRPCMMRKPPVPFGVGGRSASGNIGTIAPLSPPIQNMCPKPFVRPCCYDNKVEAKQVPDTPVSPTDEPQVSSAEITLKSATLPRRKTTKAQIQLNYPSPRPAQMEFKTEVAHNVEAPAQVRSEVVVPVQSPPSERIIPIAFDKEAKPAKPPLARFQTQKSNISQRSNSLSRQSTQDSDSETASTGEPIKKSPREYIIPIAVEGGGYVTPRAGSLEPSETASSASTMASRGKSKFGRGTRRLNSLFNDRDSEDESPFSNLHRHSSFGKDSDNEDSKRDSFRHMHQLRRIRPKKSTLEHNDSVSSGEEDDDDGFEILTAENLFSTLLSRVKDLTQRLNVDDGVRPGFPSSRLLSQFDRGTNFWNRMDHPLSRHSSLGRTFSRPSTQTSSTFNVPWRRSVSKDLASDIESVFNEQNSGSLSARVPRGDNPEENLNLAELDLNKLNLSEEDQLALSYLTPGLSRRIQKQLLAELTPAEVRKLQRTLSSKTSDEVQKKPVARRLSCTDRSNKSFLPVKDGSDYNVRSASIGAEPTKLISRPRVSRTLSSRIALPSPDSSLSESLSSTSPKSRRVSRFLRPDFYEPKDDNVFFKEKKEREQETQQVLKEIRDKRKLRLRSLSRSKEPIKQVEHDYVNVAPKEMKISRLVRPKSYPTAEAVDSEKPKKKPGSSKEDKNEANEEAHKNKLLQTIEKKLEKFRSSNKDSEDVKQEKKSVVDSAIRKLRQQSVPKTLEPCTESGLIKRAVSVEDLPLQTSRKSVTKILGLFKKYQEPKKSPEKKERPKSLLLVNGAKPDTSDKSKSKLPVVFRRSLNLEKPDLKLDFSKLEDDSTILSPSDLSCDSWSACSDFHHLTELQSPQHNGHVYSGDENESVIDRIRRKSFYTRFNERKRTRKPSLAMAYKDLDLYAAPDYSSLDRYKTPRRTSLEPSTPSTSREYRPYTRSASVMNDYVNVPAYQNVPANSLIGAYQNVPGSYQTYSSRIARPKSVTRHMYNDDSHLDGVLNSMHKRLNPYKSTLERGSVSPVSFNGTSILQSPTSEPI